MKCPICGKEIANGSMFCVYCGVQIKKSRKPLFITLFIVIVLLALGGFGYYQYAQQKQQENNNKMLNDKESYLVLVKAGDALLADKKYSESISKYNEALVYEQKYSGTGYASHFNSNVKAKISLAKQQQESDELAKKDKGSSEKVECTYSVKTVHNDTSETTTYVESASGVAQGDHEYVDLGLSVKWATCNVGASKPEDYGDYYAWGETSTKTEYTEDNSKTCGSSMGDISGNSSYDAARANWGGTWRLPTKAELEELENKCTWTWTTHNGVKGYKVTGPNGNSIFLPAAGFRHSSLILAGSSGHYWSSTPDKSSVYKACILIFNREGPFVSDYSTYDRDDGRSVRPVLE